MRLSSNVTEFQGAAAESWKDMMRRGSIRNVNELVLCLKQSSSLGRMSRDLTNSSLNLTLNMECVNQSY